MFLLLSPPYSPFYICHQFHISLVSRHVPVTTTALQPLSCILNSVVSLQIANDPPYNCHINLLKNKWTSPSSPTFQCTIITIHWSLHTPYIPCHSSKKQISSMIQWFGSLLPEIHLPSRPGPNSTFSLCVLRRPCSHNHPQTLINRFLPCANLTHYSWYRNINHLIIWCDSCRQSPSLLWFSFSVCKTPEYNALPGTQCTLNICHWIKQTDKQPPKCHIRMI